MDSSRIKELTASCFRGEPPLCADACPLRVDVRGLVGKILKRDFDGAYRLYRSKAIFPAISARVCHEPCKAGCGRAGIVPPVELAALERACVGLAKNRDPAKYPLPARTKSVAVIGAGLSGLACALRLAAKKYPVTVYEQRGRIGGRLWDLLPPEEFLPELELQFKYERYDLRLSSQIDELSAITADAIYIATGSGGQRFGVALPDYAEPFAPAPGIFMGGSILGASPVESIAHGARAAQAIEAFLKSGQPVWEDRPPTRMRPLVKNTGLRQAMRPGEAISSGPPDPAGIIDEASRCRGCDCELCFGDCDLMRRFNKYPRRIGDEVYVTLNPVDLYTHRLATRLIGSCNLCGLCKSRCPEGIDTGALLQSARKAMRADGSLPPAFHDYWLRDMAQAAGEEAGLLLAPGDKGVEYVFFPGCQLGASMPGAVEGTYRHLAEKYPGTAVMLDCCGAPLLWAGDAEGFKAQAAGIAERLKALGAPKLVFACPTCRRLLSEMLPDMAAISVYELLARDGELKVTGPPDKAAVFDACSGREFPALREDVRKLAKGAGFALAELPQGGDRAVCCGWGGHIYPANPEHAADLAQKRAALGPEPYITYCSNCRDVFAAAGKPAQHLLALLFAPEAGFDDAPPSLTRRRQNRRELKRRLLAEFGGTALDKEPEPRLRLLFAPELTARMDKDLLLEEDVRRVVEHCESTGEKLLHSDGGFSGRLRLGVVTCWVRYRPEDDGFRIIQVYSHRMSIVE